MNEKYLYNLVKSRYDGFTEVEIVEVKNSSYKLCLGMLNYYCEEGSNVYFDENGNEWYFEIVKSVSIAEWNRGME